jgi:hypothetical protein
MEVEDLARVVQIVIQMIAKEVIVVAKEMDQTKMQIKEEAVRAALELSLQSKSTILYMTNPGEDRKLEAGLESLELMGVVSEEVLNWSKILVKKVAIFLETVMIMVLEMAKRNIAAEEMGWTPEKALRRMVMETTPGSPRR